MPGPTHHHRLDIAPFTEGNLYSLGFKENWPKLRRIIRPLSAKGFAVVDLWSQALVDDTRRRFDSCVSDDEEKRNVLETISVTKADGDGRAIEDLLSLGVDPDVKGVDGWRPSHTCAAAGRLRATRAILLCRPDMQATDPGGDTPLGAALRNDYLENLETSHKKIAELAVRKIWFAVKNLVRRQVVSASEFEEKAYGRTAVEWAENFGEVDIAKELRYYASLPSARLLDLVKENESLKSEVGLLQGQLADDKEKMQTAVMQHDRALAEARKEAAAAAEAKSQEQVKSLEERCAAYDKKVGQLLETVAVLTAQIPDDQSRESLLDAAPGANKRPKLERPADAASGISPEEDLSNSNVA